MTWFAFSGLNNGKAVNLAGVQEKTATSEGFHGYATEAQAESQPNSVNFLTKVFADAFISDYKAAVSEQAQPGGKNANITNPGTAASAATSGAANAVESVIGPAIKDALSSIPFLNALTSANLWLRIAKVMLGGALLLVGTVKLVGADKSATGTVGKAVKTAVKVAPFL